jgi:8-oxo-dGTP pyrophosphatase MutT (NUDIX family)
VTENELRARLAALPLHGGPAREDLGFTEPPIAAAVLVPLVLGQCPSVLLTRRTETLARHAGQVSFPGGRIDPEDASPEAAALREAEEEIGLDPTRVELAGRLHDHLTGTGFRITPVLGLLPPGLALCAAPGEVDAIFHLPLATVLDPAAPQRRQAMWRGRMREFWVFPHDTHYIWGATAAILVQLAETLRAR